MASTQSSLPLPAGADPTVLRLMNLQGDAASGNAAHSLGDRFSSIWGTRRMLFMHPHDMCARGLIEGDMAHVTTVSDNIQLRELAGLRVMPCDLPRGSVGGYFPECSALLAASHAAAARNIAVRVKSAA